MRRSNYFLVFLTLVLFLSVSLSAQTETKLTKEQRKQLKKDQEAAAWAKVNQLAAEKTFVVEFTADGKDNTLSPRLNFIYVHQDSVVIQLQSFPGASTNGMGGFTVDGVLTDYQYSPPKKANKPIYIQFNVQSQNRSGMLNVNLTVFGDGSCSVNMGSDLMGNFVDPKESRILIGVDMMN